MTKLTLFLSLLLSLSSLPPPSLSAFFPLDNYLLDCGSTTTTVVDGRRRFVPDSSSSSTSSRSLSLTNQNPNLDSPQIYSSARIFRRPSKYEFQIRHSGTHTVRLHFQSFNSANLDWNASQFHVLVNNFVVLSNFGSGGEMNAVVKEYLIPVNGEKLVVDFVPAKKSNFAFVNAIEVISAPKDLIADPALYVSGEKAAGFDGLAEHALQVVHRVNVGGPKVTPFNDSIWRTWVTDEEFFDSGLESKRVHFGGRIKYQDGGASQEVGPDNVYNTARVIRGTNGSIAKSNMTWVFPVVGGFKYLVRMHFCDIASVTLGLLYFNVYVDGNLACEDLDVSKAANYRLASPYYVDFVVDGDDSGALTVSVGPSKSSVPYAVDGILNGIEIMKLNNSVGSLDGEHCAEWVLRTWRKGYGSLLLSLIAAACVLLSLSMVTHRRIMKKKELVEWTKLPVDISEVNTKHGSTQPSNKLECTPGSMKE